MRLIPLILVGALVAIEKGRADQICPDCLDGGNGGGYKPPVPLWLFPLLQGQKVLDGRDGERGKQGWQGMQGNTGAVGDTGDEKGDKGSRGYMGDAGEKVRPFATVALHAHELQSVTFALVDPCFLLCLYESQISCYVQSYNCSLRGSERLRCFICVVFCRDIREKWE